MIRVGPRGSVGSPAAGLRYTLAFVALLPFWLRRGGARSLRSLSPGMWLRLALLGLLYYTVTQGAQFLALVHLPAVTISLLLSSSALAVAFLSPLLLSESPSAWQWAGIALYAAGVLAYFWPLRLPEGTAVGLLIALVAVLANALSSILGRSVNRSLPVDALSVTVVSMGIGGTLLLAAGLFTEGWRPPSSRHWAMIGYLAVVSGAVAFTLWNHTLRTLTATRSSLLNNTMLFQIGVLGWIFLGEAMSPLGIVGAVIATAGVAVAQAGPAVRAVRAQRRGGPGVSTPPAQPPQGPRDGPGE